MQRPMISLEGIAELHPIRSGTASAHEGMVLAMDDGTRLILVRLGGHPFHDEETRALVGRRIKAHEYEVNGELRYASVEILPQK